MPRRNGKRPDVAYQWATHLLTKLRADWASAKTKR